MTYELNHTADGLALHRFRDDGWEILQEPYGGGHKDWRCQGGWWLYKGDHQEARAAQHAIWTKELIEIKRDLNRGGW